MLELMTLDDVGKRESCGESTTLAIFTLIVLVLHRERHPLKRKKIRDG